MKFFKFLLLGLWGLALSAYASDNYIVPFTIKDGIVPKNTIYVDFEYNPSKYNLVCDITNTGTVYWAKFSDEKFIMLPFEINKLPIARNEQNIKGNFTISYQWGPPSDIHCFYRLISKK